MNITNKTLITLITSLGEDKAVKLLQTKLDDDKARREYHAKYNARKNEALKIVKRDHPELFKAAMGQSA